MAGLKKIILVISNSRGVNQAFVTDDLQYLLLDDAIALAKLGLLKGIQLVEAKGRTYLRSRRSSSENDNLDNLSVPAGSAAEKIKVPAVDEPVSVYAKAYGKFLELRFERNELLYFGRVARISKRDVIKRIRPLAKKIKDAATKYEVDAGLLAAILIDERARLGPDDFLDILGKLNVVDTTVGLAQIKMSTARDLIAKKYYPADPNITQSALYELLTDDANSVQFAAANLSYIRKIRKNNGLGVSGVELASCYSRGPKKSITQRGKNINSKLRKFAEEFLE